MSDIPDKGFVDEHSIYRKRRPSVVVPVRRDVVDPVLFRNSEDDRAETEEFNGELHAKVNPEKFVSRERQTGLDLLRFLDEDGDLIHPAYAYNEPGSREEALNLDTVAYGNVGTDDVDYGIKSRVTVGYTYSTDEYNIMDSETRNAVYESGTMTDDEGDHSEALYDQVRVQPGNSFIHFVTLEAGTPGLLAYVLHNFLTTTNYGARDTRSGKTLNNEILGLIVSHFSVSLSTGELLREYHDFEGDIDESVAAYIEDAARSDWDIYGERIGHGDFPEWFDELLDVAGRQTDDALDWMRGQFVEETDEIREVY